MLLNAGAAQTGAALRPKSKFAAVLNAVYLTVAEVTKTELLETPAMQEMFMDMDDRSISDAQPR